MTTLKQFTIDQFDAHNRFEHIEDLYGLALQLVTKLRAARSSHRIQSHTANVGEMLVDKLQHELHEARAEMVLSREDTQVVQDAYRNARELLYEKK